MNNLLCIVGATATGKTRLAEKIQSRCDSAELISIDSRQVYIGMDIGTGKDAKIFGTDLVKPEKLFNVSDFAKIVRPKIEELWRKNITPILVGGTGLYLKAVIDGIETMEIPPNTILRGQLSKLNLKELQDELRIKNYELGIKRRNCGMNNSDWNNPRRLIRRIEILTNTNQYYQILTNKKTTKLQTDNALLIGLSTPMSQIIKNIEKRVQERLDKGLLEEIKKLVEEYGWNEVLRNTISYREWEDYFSEKISKEEAISRWTKDEIDYAKRQLTWFKKESRVVWLQEDYLEQSLKIIDSVHLFD